MKTDRLPWNCDMFVSMRCCHTLRDNETIVQLDFFSGRQKPVLSADTLFLFFYDLSMTLLFAKTCNLILQSCFTFCSIKEYHTAIYLATQHYSVQICTDTVLA